MSSRIHCTITAFTTALLLASAVSTAAARTLSTTSQTFRVTWRELLFDRGSVNCEVTLEGSFHSRTIAKIRGSLIGYITNATFRHPCRTGELWADNGREEFLGRRSINSLPWHLTYENFGGTLPNITFIDLLLRQTSFVVNAGGGICLGRYGRPEDNITLRGSREAGGAITTLAPVAGRNIWSLRERLGGIFCPAILALEGPGSVSSSEGTRVTITLI